MGDAGSDDKKILERMMDSAEAWGIAEAEGMWTKFGHFVVFLGLFAVALTSNTVWLNPSLRFAVSMLGFFSALLMAWWWLTSWSWKNYWMKHAIAIDRKLHAPRSVYPVFDADEVKKILPPVLGSNVPRAPALGHTKDLGLSIFAVAASLFALVAIWSFPADLVPRLQWKPISELWVSNILVGGAAGFIATSFITFLRILRVRGPDFQIPGLRWLGIGEGKMNEEKRVSLSITLHFGYGSIMGALGAFFIGATVTPILGENFLLDLFIVVATSLFWGAIIMSLVAAGLLRISSYLARTRRNIGEYRGSFLTGIPSTLIDHALYGFMVGLVIWSFLALA